MSRKLMITDDSFKLYSKEVTKSAAMKPKREREISLLMTDPNTTDDEKELLKKELVEGYLKLVIKEAGKLSNVGVEAIDLISEGNFGLMKAVNAFDFSKGYRFSTYAYHWIRQAMLSYIYDNARTIRLPVNVAQELHRQVKRLNETEKELDIKMSNLPDTTNLFRIIKGDEDSGSLVDIIENANADLPDKRLTLKDTVAQLLKRLNDKECKVIKLSFGLDGVELDTKEIAEEMKMNPESIRLIRLRALEKMIKFARPNNR